MKWKYNYGINSMVNVDLSVKFMQKKTSVVTNTSNIKADVSRIQI